MSAAENSSPGDVVRNARTLKGWSQFHCAEAAGISRRTMSRLESGEKPSYETALALASALEIDVCLILQIERTSAIDPVKAVHSFDIVEEIGLNASKRKRLWLASLILAPIAVAGLILSPGNADHPGGLPLVCSDLPSLCLSIGGLYAAYIASALLSLISVAMPFFAIVYILVNWSQVHVDWLSSRLGNKVVFARNETYRLDSLFLWSVPARSSRFDIVRTCTKVLDVNEVLSVTTFNESATEVRIDFVNGDGEVVSIGGFKKNRRTFQMAQIWSERCQALGVVAG